MDKLLDRLPILLEERLEIFPILQNNVQIRTKDRNGSASASLSNSLRFIGVAKYILNQDTNKFRMNLTEAARLRKDLFIRYESGEPISESYVSMLAYKSLFDALAAGEFELAKEFASFIGGRESLEKEYDHPFDYSLGYTLKAFILEELQNMEKWATEFDTICESKENAAFQGYAKMFRAILMNDSEAGNEALALIVAGHKKESRGRGVFKGTDDELLCVWGIGIANLAKMYKLNLSPIPPLIPLDLLV